MRFVGGLSKTIPIALGVAPFCAKRNTPLDRMPYAGIRTVEARLERLRRGLRGRADVRAVRRRGHGSSTCSHRAACPKRLSWRSTVRCVAGGHFAAYRRRNSSRSATAPTAAATPKPKHRSRPSASNIATSIWLARCLRAERAPALLPPPEEAPVHPGALEIVARDLADAAFLVEVGEHRHRAAIEKLPWVSQGVEGVTCLAEITTNQARRGTTGSSAPAGDRARTANVGS